MAASRQVPEFNLLRLLEVLGRESISFRTLDAIDDNGFVRVDELGEALEQDGWVKTYDGSEDPDWCCGNFDVVYTNGGYEVVLRCNEDGYVFQIGIAKVTRE